MGRSQDTLADRLARYDRVVEVGIGRHTAVAAALADRGVTVTATDVHERETPESVAFVRDDVTAPDRAVYEDADALFARNLPPELHRPFAELAAAVGAEALFTTLGGDPPTVPVATETLDRTTLYVVRSRG